MEAAPELSRYLRATLYLAGAQIYLRSNVLLKKPLKPEHVKDRLLGHWGTCPGINLVYAHLNRVVRESDRGVLLVTGPGHGAPAVLANAYLDGTLEAFYPALTRDAAGLERFIQGFSWPGGFPSHLFPGVPGTIHEGGELGYALATASGAALDNPDLVVACIVGDGEAETGPTAAAWHCTKFMDPRESGAVLPILHLNGYKISNPTIYGTMSDEELGHYFTGCGWRPEFVEGPDLEGAMGSAVDRAFAEIDRLQKLARGGTAESPSRWPMIILRSPKGWTGVKTLDGKPVEGSFRSHQVPVEDVKENAAHLKIVEDWLRSYRPEELFDEEGHPAADILAACPSGDRRLGCNPHAFGGRMRVPLRLPELKAHSVEVSPSGRGSDSSSPVEAVARYLARLIADNPTNFRIFSPDELISNKLGGIFKAPTERDYQWPVEGGGRTEHVGSHGGRVLEILSEHTCQAWLQGYLLTGRHGLFPSYESFLTIVTSMMDQFAKFLKMSGEFSWRLPVPSLTYLETSTLWRQEHNGFSHQSPGFINSLLNKKGDVMRVYLPPDANCLLSTIDHCLAGTDHVNLVIANKNPMPQWLSLPEAIEHCRAGASIWTWASTQDGVSPDVVMVGIGDVMMLEVMAAADILRREVPQLRLRVVNVTDLLILERETAHPHGLDDVLFESLFTADAPVIVNFHGYASAVKQLVYGRRLISRFQVNGYREEGTTTTPFDMLVRNGTSRFDLVKQALRAAAPRNPAVATRVSERVLYYDYVLRDFAQEILRTGRDPEMIRKWTWRP
ncbi:MAG TPA: phosphoketolase family protein [Opitutaceae bacterium]|nr:phosphoketolase family protein [Opitutaceae bacterium]